MWQAEVVGSFNQPRRLFCTAYITPIQVIRVTAKASYDISVTLQYQKPSLQCYAVSVTPIHVCGNYRNRVEQHTWVLLYSWLPLAMIGNTLLEPDTMYTLVMLLFHIAIKHQEENTVFALIYCYSIIVLILLLFNNCLYTSIQT